MNYDCDLIIDLIPLYIDGILSKTSQNIVSEHIKQCKDCNDLVENSKESKINKIKNVRNYESKELEYSRKVKNIRKALIIFIASIFILGIFIGVSLLGGRFDYREVKFRNHSEAIEYIEKGWIPKNIPRSAKNINIIYSIDSNIVNGKFDLDFIFLERFKEDLEEISVDEFKKDIQYSTKKFKKIIDYKDNTFFKDNENLYVINNASVYFFTRYLE